MSKNPVRLTDTHHCPKKENQPHSDGQVITANTSNVIFENQPVACEGDKVKCQDGSTTIIQEGNACVMVNGKRIALMEDKTDHGGKLTSGASTIHVDEGKPFVFIGKNVTIGKNVSFNCKPNPPYDQHFILYHDLTDEVMADISYILTTASGKVISGVTNAEGKTQLVGHTSAELVAIELLEI